MLNIEIHGLPAEMAKEAENQIFSQLAMLFGKVGEKTIVDDTLVETYCENTVRNRHGRQAPFIRVFAGSRADIIRAMQVLKLACPSLDVYCILIHWSAAGE